MGKGFMPFDERERGLKRVLFLRVFVLNAL